MRRLYDNPEERIAAAESAIAQQAQRIAELEGELVDRDKRLEVAKSLVREQVQTAAANLRLIAERDEARRDHKRAAKAFETSEKHVEMLTDDRDALRAALEKCQSDLKRAEDFIGDMQVGEHSHG